MSSNSSNQRQSAPTGAQESEFKQGADRPLGDASCSLEGFSLGGVIPPDSHSEPTNRTSNGESPPTEPSHLRFESMMSELVGHPAQLAVIADRKPHPDRLVFLAALHLWREQGHPNHAEWRAMCASDDLQERVQALLQDRGKEVLSLWGMDMSEDGRIFISERQSAPTGAQEPENNQP